MKISAIVCASALAWSCGSASAAVLAYDEFNYTAGASISGLNGNTSSGWTSAWSLSGATSNMTIQTPGYAYTGLGQTPASTGYLRDSANDRKQALRNFADAGDVTYGTSKRYVAVLIDQGGDVNMYRNGNGSSTWSIGLKEGSAVNGQGYAYIGSGYDSAVQSTSEVYASNAVHLLVARIDKSAKTVELFVDPNLSLGEAGNTPVLSNTFSSLTAAQMFNTTASLDSKNSNGGGWDSLRIATTWNEAVGVPEPTLAGVLGIAGFGLTRRRRQA